MFCMVKPGFSCNLQFEALHQVSIVHAGTHTVSLKYKKIVWEKSNKLTWG